MTDSSSQTADFRTRRWVPLLALTVLGAMLVGTIRGWPWGGANEPLPPIAPSLREAKLHFSLGRFAEAERIASELLTDRRRDSELLLLAAESATRQGQPENALRYYGQLLKEDQEDYLKGLWSSGGLLLHLGRPSDSERTFREVLKRSPQNVVAHRNLAFLLSATGRRFESLPHLLALLKLGVPTLEDLLFLGNPIHAVDHSEFLEFAREKSPQDPLPPLGMANVAMFHHETEKAGELIRRSLTLSSELAEAHALWGRYLIETRNAEALDSWLRETSASLDWHPEIWFVRGVVAQERGELDVAIRCYWETLVRHPDHATANYRIGQLLVARGKQDWARVFSFRAEKQEELNRVINPIYSEGPDLDRMLRAARYTAELGRPWESWAWYRLIADNFPNQIDADAISKKLLTELKSNPPRTTAFLDESMRRELATYPLPSPTKMPGRLPGGAPSPNESTPIRFAGAGARLGLHFQYFNSDDPKEPGTPIYHQLGGGIGCMDFDLDGWPDLYLSQGTRWPPQENADEFQDQLFQNRGGAALVDVTQAAGLGDTRYSQGVAAGDWNNDGFSDLRVANIGGSRLYVNLGDGTFSEVAGEHATRPDWTTSCAIADIDGDGNADLFDVNYLDGEAPFKLVCRGGKACSPNHFIGQPDQLYLSRGDGGFRRSTEEAGVVSYDGKGLGLVIADFDDSGRLGVFVSNDTTANSFFVPETPRGAPQLRMSEQSLLSGLAYDRDGLAQACMGIGADDADNDGWLDFFVTNFYNESNTLYKQVGPNLFVDETREADLREPSMSMLGFGTQFLDADLDGHPDLVVANGHVDDYRDTGAAYKMRPQYFHNLGGGRYQEVPSPSLGDYFLGEYLGRSLAKFDFNRDGRPDFAVIHLDAPCAVVANETATDHHFLSLRLVGLGCERDAIGARVTVETDAGSWTKQLTAGDGFQASNQRLLHFGMGPSKIAKRVAIRWPHRVLQEHFGVPADREWLAIEGRSELVELPRE